MIGNHLPGGALTYMILVGLVWNGLAGRISRKLALSPKELVVVLCSTLVACFPPTSGLFRYFHRIVVLPWYYLPGNPEWAQYNLLQYIKPSLFPEPYLGNGLPEAGTQAFLEYQRVYQGMFSGLAQGVNWVPLAELPFRAWAKALLYWGPLIFLFALVCIALQFVAHRQWVHHEQLSYPLAQVTSQFCHRDDNRPGVPDIFKSRLFWWGFVPVFLFYVLDFLGAKYPMDLPRMKDVFPSLRNWWLPVQEAFPAVLHSNNYWNLCTQSLFFTIVGAAFFVSTEIALTMGLNVILLVAFGIIYYYNVGTPLGANQLNTGRAGAYLGYTLILLYTGRTYFKAVFARAFGSRKAKVEDDGTAVLAARVLIVAFVATVVVLHAMEIEWTLAVLYTLATMMMFFVFTRIICETGIPFMQTQWVPPDLFVSLFGPATLGPKGLVMLQWTNVAITQDPRECLMPYVATSVKVADDNKLSLKRVFCVICVAVVLAVGIAFLASHYTQYNSSAMTDGYASNHAVLNPFNVSARLVREMHDVGEFAAASEGNFFTRLPLMHANPSHLRFFIAGILAVFACSFLRFKFSKFPIHPVLFLVVGCMPAMNTWGSFMVGWFVKMLVVRFGGGGVYQKLKPLFVGLIAGEVFFIGVHIIFNLVYQSIFQVAPSFGVTPLPG